MVSRPFVINRDVVTGLGTDGLLVAYTAVRDDEGYSEIVDSDWDIFPATAEGLVTALDRMIKGDGDDQRGGLVRSLQPETAPFKNGVELIQGMLEHCDPTALNCVLRFQGDGDTIEIGDSDDDQFLDSIEELRSVAMSRGTTPIERLILSARLHYGSSQGHNEVHIDMKVGSGPEWTV